MTCESAQAWILNAEAPDNLSAAPPEIDSHIGNCTYCQKQIRDIAHLEKTWRELPSAPQSEAAKNTFLKRLNGPAQPATRTARPNRLKRSLAWISIAALVLVAGAGVLFFWPSDQPVQAQSDVLEQLVDWNLELTEAQSPADRERIFTEKHEKLTVHLRKAKLSHADRELAENLLANGSWLAQNNDPVEELNRFNHLADRFVETMQGTTESADPVQSQRLARQYAKIAERGIDGNLARIERTKLVDPERKLKLKKMLKADKEREAMLLVLVEKGPAATHKELKKALELSHKRHKKKKEEKQPND